MSSFLEEPAYGGYWHLDEALGPTSMTVETEEEETFTGLYDADGNPLHRQKFRCGFI